MPISFYQKSLFDTFNNCQHFILHDKFKFFELINSYINIDSFISSEFELAFYKRLGRDRKYSLYSFIAALIFQKTLSIPTDTLLIQVLRISSEAKNFCRLTSVPDASKFTRFRQDFLPYIEKMFNYLVDLTEPICQKLDSTSADSLILDTSAIKPFVKENNPKYFAKILKGFKKFHKSLGDDAKFNVYDKTFKSMPAHASVSEDIKKAYVNGHFAYAFKFGIVCNGLGVPRYIVFLDNDFKNKFPSFFPDIDESSLSPTSGKTIADNANSIRLFPGVARNSEEWSKSYKGRTIIERTIDHIKINMCTAGRKTNNKLSIKADLLMAGIVSQLSVILADLLNKPSIIRSVKALIA